MTPETTDAVPARCGEPVDATTVRAWAGRTEGPTLLDVRAAAEFETAHVPGAHNVPLGLLGEHAAAVAARLGPATVLVCQSGTRAEDARRRLVAAGADPGGLHVLAGGMPAWAAAGGDVVRGRPRWAMERQVRLAAGLLVLTGTLLSLVLPLALLLAIGVGAGLTFSALSNTCGMARALSMLPYNRGPAARDAAEVLAALPGARV